MQIYAVIKNDIYKDCGNVGNVCDVTRKIRMQNYTYEINST